MKSFFILTLLFLFAFLLNSFVEDYTNTKISKKDVVFKVPAGFPEPLYDFKNNKLTLDGFILGRKLFYDPILSADNVTSCASCHQRFAAFAHIDHPLSHGIQGKVGKRNVPGLYNLVWKDAFMADGGINHLDFQPIAPITSPTEMGETLDNVLRKLRTDSLYPFLFRRAFGDTSVTTERLVKSLSQFLCLMISNNSKYDKFIAGKAEFTDQETRGLNLFRSKCASCHKEPLFTDNSYRDIGIRQDTIINDKGRAAITGLQSDKFKFKVPSLRNVEVTYPYGHDGRFRKLREIVRHYASPEAFTSSVDTSLYGIGHLSQEDQKDIISFLLTLTDKEFLNDNRFADPASR